MSLANVTPVVLTFNEEPNVGRTLESLRPFARVVVVDSGSTDRTEEIARSFPNVVWFVRPWSGFRDQWTFALHETGIATPFVLALDADMSVTDELIHEIGAVVERPEVAGGVCGFEYRIAGRSLIGSLYPSQLRLLRLSLARAGEIGHAHLLEVDGSVVRMRHRLVHDDRKPLEAFVDAQLGYSAKEASRLEEQPERGMRVAEWVRRSIPFSPILVWALAWLRAGGPLRGAAARRYALERLMYETLLRYRIEDRLLEHEARPDPGAAGLPQDRRGEHHG